MLDNLRSCTTWPSFMDWSHLPLGKHEACSSQFLHSTMNINPNKKKGELNDLVWAFGGCFFLSSRILFFFSSMCSMMWCRLWHWLWHRLWHRVRPRLCKGQQQHCCDKGRHRYLSLGPNWSSVEVLEGSILLAESWKKNTSSIQGKFDYMYNNILNIREKQHKET